MQDTVMCVSHVSPVPSPCLCACVHQLGALFFPLSLSLCVCRGTVGALGGPLVCVYVSPFDERGKDDGQDKSVVQASSRPAGNM